MFEELVDQGELADVDDATVVAAIEGWTRAEAAVAARRLAAIAELVARRCDDQDGQRWQWACDYWDAAAAEVSCAARVSPGKASGDMHTAWSLRTRLPAVAALFLSGELSARVAGSIVARTDCVVDDAVIAVLDTEIAQRATRWGPLSAYKTEQAIDVLVDTHDPGALRRTQTAARSRGVQIGGRDDPSGTASVWGRLYATDATLLDRRLRAMAHAVCDDDPRTLAQRRADALGALAAGADHLACTCGGSQCPAAGDDGRASSVVVHVVAEASALQGQPDPGMDGDTTAIETGADAAPAPQPRRAAGLIPGGGIVPAPLLAALIRSGAKVRFMTQPGADPELRYRPSTALDEFVRIRDLTCRFPNCDRLAEYCDLDHTIAWPAGATHPSNLKTYCRKHHLLKTFWTDAGWADQQHPDGTITFTTPTGRTYTTRPGSRVFFPAWNTTTAPLSPTSSSQANSGSDRQLMMPKRKRTRAQARDYRIKAERALNDTHVAERNIPPPF